MVKQLTQSEATDIIVQTRLAASLPIITEAQAAMLLQISVLQMRRLREMYNLPHFRAGRSTIRYNREELLAALQTLPAAK